MMVKFYGYFRRLNRANGVADMMTRHCGTIVIKLIPVDSKRIVVNTEGRLMNLILLKIALG